MSADISVLGFLGSDLDSKIIPTKDGEVELLTGSVASTRGKWNKETQAYDDVTTWFRIEFWVRGRNYRNAESYNYVKGSQVFVEGEFSIESYVDKEGETRTSPTIYATKLLLVPRDNAPKAAAATTARSGRVGSAKKSPWREETTPHSKSRDYYDNESARTAKETSRSYAANSVASPERRRAARMIFDARKSRTRD